MYANEALKEVMYQRRVNQTTLANALKVTRQNMNKRMTQKNPHIQTLGEALALLGYEIVVQPAGTHLSVPGQFVIGKDEVNGDE